MDYHFNTLIIGGGPSGSSCGITLTKGGVDCCIVDKYSFPRTKLCAGLFTGKSQMCLSSVLGHSVYEDALKKCLVAKEERFALYKKTYELVSCDLTSERNKPVSLRYDDCRIKLVDRPLLDEFLVRHFCSLGGTLIEGDAVKTIDFETKVATLVSGTTIRYENLVAADGANSPTEKMLAAYDNSFKKKGESALCLEINVDRADLDIHGVNIYFDVVEGSYAWSFSKGEKVCLGLVKLPWQKDVDANKRMRDFCSQLGVANMDKYPLRGAMLPFGNIMPCPVYSDNTYFIGDAAGLVEPLTGEGIYYALQSGQYAGESILKGGVDAYMESVKYLHSLIKKGCFYQSLLEKKWATRFFFNHAPRNARFISHFYLSQIEHATLDSFAKIIWKYKRGRV